MHNDTCPVQTVQATRLINTIALVTATQLVRNVTFSTKGKLAGLSITIYSTVGSSSIDEAQRTKCIATSTYSQLVYACGRRNGG